MTMREPMNSWEITYVFSIMRPNINLGLTKEEAYLKVGYQRAKELRKWANESGEFGPEWIKWHI
jgi:hypothetical protein